MAESVAPPRPTLEEIQNQLGNLINESGVQSVPDSAEPATAAQQVESTPATADSIIEQPLVDQPEASPSPELVQQKIDSIHLNEVHSVSQAVLKKKAESTEANMPPQLRQRLNKYKNIRDLAQVPDGPTKFKQDEGKASDEFNLTLGDNEAPYVRIEKINGVETYVPSSFLDTRAIRILTVSHKSGEQLKCKGIDSNGNSINADIRIDVLADAQMHFVLAADGFESSFTPHETEVLQAYDDLAQNGNETAVKKLYTGDAIAIKETARNNGFITADSVRTYLDTIYAEVQPKPGEQLTPQQQAQNETLREKKANIIIALNLDAREIADSEVMVGVVTQTIGTSLDNLKAAIDSETDPGVRQLYEDTFATLSKPESQKQLPEVMKTAMQDMTPEFAMAMNKSLQTGDVKGLYSELIKKFPSAQSELDTVKPNLDKLLVGGLGIVAILTALLGTVAAAGMKPSR